MDYGIIKSRNRNDRRNGKERKIMNTEKIKEIINQYFDNELTKSEEVLLFTQLSQNEGARSYFKEMNLLKTVMTETVKDYPQSLDDKILPKLKGEEKIIYAPKPINRVVSYSSYALAIFLLALSIFF